MNSFSFTVSEYGLFDSRVKFPTLLWSEDRQVTEYELEFFPADYPAVAFINNRKYPMQRGTFLCGKPGQLRHSKLPFRCYYFHISTDDPALNKILQSIPDAGFLSCMDEITTVFRELLLLDANQDSLAQLALHSGVCRVIRLMAQNGSPNAYTNAHAEIILRAEQYIQAHLSEPLPLESIAAAVNLSPYYFHRLFTDFFGRTPAQYILNCRISNAKLELLKENCSLAQLTADCGFSSQSYFCYKFKQVTGKTPLQYRREMLSQLNV